MKKFSWFTWEVVVLALYAIGVIGGVFTGVGELHEAYILDWWHVAFGLIWSVVTIIATWSLAEKHTTK